MNKNVLCIDMNSEGVNGAVGRVQGIAVKDKIIKQFHEKNPEKIILDFTNVSYVTSGLAKELFGGLFEEFGLSMKEIISIRVGKDNAPLKTTILRALATVMA